MSLLGMRKPAWSAPGAAPARRYEKPRPKLDADLALLLPYCAPCHADERRHPPGFLAGDDVTARVSRCAPRLLQRLRAWQPNNAYPHSPMPPPVSIAFSGMSASEWPQSDHYRSLIEGLEKLLPPERPNDRQQPVYADLPACLPR